MLSEKCSERNAQTSGCVLTETNRLFECKEDLDEGPLSSPADISLKATAQGPSVSASTLSIALIDQYSFTRGCITNWLIDCGKHIKVNSFASAEDLLQSEGT